MCSPLWLGILGTPIAPHRPLLYCWVFSSRTTKKNRDHYMTHYFFRGNPSKNETCHICIQVDPPHAQGKCPVCLCLKVSHHQGRLLERSLQDFGEDRWGVGNHEGFLQDRPRVMELWGRVTWIITATNGGCSPTYKWFWGPLCRGLDEICLICLTVA